MYDPIRTVNASIEDYGHLSINTSKSFKAGSFVTLCLDFQVGSRGLATGAKIRLFTECDSDWGRPQISDPSTDNYLTIENPPNTTIATTIQDHNNIVITLLKGTIKPGAHLLINIGDTSGGSKGTRIQTFYEDLRYFILEIDEDGTGQTKRFLEPKSIKIVGGEAVSFIITAPPDVNINLPFSISIKTEDLWGNPAQAYEGTLLLDASGIVLPEKQIRFVRSDKGVKVVPGCIISEPGILRVTAKDPLSNIESVSNPINAFEQEPKLKLFWGDPHSGQVADARKIGDYFLHARDIAKLHFAGFQRNDRTHSTEAYHLQQKQEDLFHEPGVFVPMPGFEWSGELEMGGHHNVYFRRFGQQIKRCEGSLEQGLPNETDLPHVLDLHSFYRNSDTVITPHVGGTHADLRWHDPSLEPVLEIVSTHGTFEWFLRESIQRGYKMGFVGGNDCHTGRPGDDQPGHQLRRYAKGGLTGIYANHLDLESVLDALKARHCYATTGARIRAYHTVAGAFMGSEVKSRYHPKISVEVSGTGPLEQIDVYRGLDCILRENIFTNRSTNRVRITWKGASRKSSYSGVVWNGRINIKGGSITAIDSIRFDSPRSQYKNLDNQNVQWQSWTCGYTSGLIVELEKPDDSALNITIDSKLMIGEKFPSMPSRRIAFAQGDSVQIPVKLSDLETGPVEVELGDVDRVVIVEMEPKPSAWEAQLDLTDKSPKPGVNPYWVRVTQMNQEVAWLSPVFFDFVKS